MLLKFEEAYGRLRGEIGQVIVGQDKVIEELLTALFVGGHCLLVGVPGLAKTLLVSTVARSLNLKFSRIQFTPDLMPSDITGTEVLEEDPATRRRVFRFIEGPVFANVVLADEINRTPPKTQSALLQAMQEYQVTAGGNTYRLEKPFFVLATQNPIELEGTYPLPEAQLDRFMFNIKVDYPSDEEELRIIDTTTSRELASPAAGALGRRYRRDTAAREERSRLGGRSALRRAPHQGEQGREAPRDRAVSLVGGRAARRAVSHPRRQGARDHVRPDDPRRR